MFASFDDVRNGHLKHYSPIFHELQINEERNGDTTRIYFSHHITAWFVKGKFSSVSGDGIAEITFNARKTPGL